MVLGASDVSESLDRFSAGWDWEGGTQCPPEGSFHVYLGAGGDLPTGWGLSVFVVMPRTKKPEWKLPEWVELRQSGIHGSGLFAAKLIPRGTRILEYKGERLNKTDSYRRAMQQLRKAKKNGGGAVYIFEVNSRWDIDGNVDWNPARLINHSCQPNCKVYDLRGRIWIYAKRRIQPGEELSYDYGYDLDHFRDHPCHCGAEGCVGYIVRRDQWPRLRRALLKDQLSV